MDEAYGAFPQVRVCFSCGIAEPVDVAAEDTPAMRRYCPECGSPMFRLSAVEAYHDRFIFDAEFLEKSAEKLEFMGDSDFGGVNVGEFELGERRFRYAAPAAVFEKYAGLRGRSPVHALRMLRSEAKLLTRDWKHPVMGSFRPFGEPASSLMEAMYRSGRFTVEDCSRYDATTSACEKYAVVRTPDERFELPLRAGVDPERFVDAHAAVVHGKNPERRFALVASACRANEETTSTEVDPAFVAFDDPKGAEDVQKMIDAAVGDSGAVTAKIDDGQLKFEAVDAWDLAKAAAAVGSPMSESKDGSLGVFHVSKASLSSVLSAADGDVPPDLTKAQAAVFGSIAGSTQDAGSVVSIDDIGGGSVDDVVDALEALEREGYVEAQDEAKFYYRLTKKGRRLAAVGEELGKATYADVVDALRSLAEALSDGDDNLKLEEDPDGRGFSLRGRHSGSTVRVRLRK
jgi:hypothetical protein